MKRSLRKTQSGQTLLLGLMALVVLLFVVFFLFDVQSIIRAKFKSSTAVDAAALVGANWQRYTLNMIGDLNLLQASSLMISGLPGAPGGLASYQHLLKIGELSTNMREIQRRISFVGPAIGLGAAQQAAKHNGLNYNEAYGATLENHLELLQTDIYAPPNVPEFLDQFNWREPYFNMLYGIYNGGKGMAVAVNSTSVSYPSLSSTSGNIIGYLTSKRTYEAITYNYWCDLRGLLREDFSGKWWGEIDISWNSAGFIGECEFFPVGIRYLSSSNMLRSVRDMEHVNSLIVERGLTPIWRVSDEFDPQHEEDTDNYFSPYPHISWATFSGDKWYTYDNNYMNEWEDYLRNPMKDEYKYHGCHAYVWSEIDPITISGSVLPVGNDPKMTTQRMRASQTRLNTPHTVRASATAKPLGSLITKEGNMPPHYAARMILPCFTRSAIIPVSLEPETGPDPFDQKWFAFLTEYLPALGAHGDLESMGPDTVPDPSHWPWFIFYHNALLKLNDPAWRQMGIDWLDTPILDKDGKKSGTYEDTCDKPEEHGPGSAPVSGPSILH